MQCLDRYNELLFQAHLDEFRTLASSFLSFHWIQELRQIRIVQLPQYIITTSLSGLDGERWVKTSPFDLPWLDIGVRSNA